MVSLPPLKPSSQRSKLPSNSSPSSPDKDTDSTSSPESSVFQKGYQKLCSSLILFSFLFQTLWPSYSWSSDVLTQVIYKKQEGLSLSLRQAALLAEEEDLKLGRLSLPFIDEIPEDFSSFRLSLPSLPALRDLKEETAFQRLKHDLRGHKLYADLYADLSRGTSGGVDALLWSSYGFHFTLKDNGELSVTGDPALIALKRGTLRIYNPNGFLNLDQDLTITHLLAKADSLIHTGAVTSIDTLEVWATGKDGRAGHLFNESGKTLSSAQIILHQGSLENRGHLLIAEKGFLDCRDHALINYQDIALGGGAALKNVQTLDNRYDGLIGGLRGEDAYTIDAQTLENRGRIQGLRTLRIQKGYNAGLIQSKRLTFSLSERFINQAGLMDIEGRVLKPPGLFEIMKELHTKGTGTFLQEAVLQAKHLILDNKSFQETSGRFHRYQDVVLGPHVETWNLSKDPETMSEDDTESVWDVHTLTLQGAKDSAFSNNGTLTVQSQLNTQNPDSSFFNRKQATLEVLGDADLNLYDFLNDGSVTIKGQTTGSVQRLFNSNFFSLEGDVWLKGETLVNAVKSVLRGGSVFDWRGDRLHNRGTFTVFDNQIEAQSQLINHALFLWTHNVHKASHLLNMGLMERTDALEKKGALPFCYDRRETFQQDTLENRGILNTVISYVPQMTVSDQPLFKEFKHWVNHRQMTLQEMCLGAESFVNTDTMKVLGSVTGEAHSFDNQHFLQANQEVNLKGQDFANTGKVLTSDRLTIGFKERIDNRGHVQAEAGFTLSAKHLDNQGKLIGSTLGQESVLDISETITTGKDSHLYVHSLHLKTKEMQHEGILRHGTDGKDSQTTLEALKLFNLGTIDRAEKAFSASLDIRSSFLNHQDFIGAGVLLLDVDEITSGQKAEMIADSAFYLFSKNDYIHQGLIRAKKLIYKTPTGSQFSPASFALINRGQIVSTETTWIRGRFHNTSEGDADLSGLTLEEFPSPLIKPLEGSAFEPFVNEGRLRLSNLQSLGQEQRRVINGQKGKQKDKENAKAILLFENTGTTDGSSWAKLGRSPKKDGFAFGGFVNYGTIAFGSGTYHIKQLFENQGIQRALAGQNLWYADLNNRGEIQSTGPHQLDHRQEGGAAHLGSVRVKGELLLKLSDDQDVADVLHAHDLLAEHGVTVEGNRFTNHSPLTLLGAWILRLKALFDNQSTMETGPLSVFGRESGGGFRVGVTGKLGELNVYGPLTVDVPWDIDNGWGVIRTLGQTQFKTLGDFYGGAAVQGGPHKLMRNGAKIAVQRGGLEILSQNITTSFGGVYSEGLALFKALQKIKNQSGKIYGSSKMVFEAEELDNLIGDVYVVPGVTHTVSHRWRQGGRDHTPCYRDTEYVEGVRSDPAEIKTTGSTIEVKVNKGVNRGSVMLAANTLTITHKGPKKWLPVYPNLLTVMSSEIEAIRQKIGYNSFSYDSSTGHVTCNGSFVHQVPPLYDRYAYESSFDHEDVALKTTRNAWEFGLNYLVVSGKDERVHQTYKALGFGGQQLNVEIDDMLITGTMGAPIVSFSVNNFLLHNKNGKKRADLPSHTILIHLSEVLANLLPGHPLFKDDIQAGKGVSLDGIGKERGLARYHDVVRMGGTPLHKSPRFVMSPEVTRLVFMEALIKTLGSLNVKGDSGDRLFDQFVDNGLEVERRLAKAGRPLTWEDLKSFNKSCLVQSIEEMGGQLYSVLHLLASYEDIMPYTEDGGSVVGDLLTIKASNTIDIEGGAVYSTISTSLKALQDLTVRSIAQRRGGLETYREEKLAAILGSKGFINTYSGRDTEFVGIETYADMMTVYAKGNGIDRPLELHSREKEQGPGRKTIKTHVHNSSSHHVHKHLYRFFTEGNQIQVAPHIRVLLGDILFESVHALRILEAHDSHTFEETLETKKKGFLCTTSGTVQKKGYEVQGQGAQLGALAGEIKAISYQEDVTLVNINALTPTFYTKAENGTITFALGTTFRGFSRSEQIEDLWWQRFSSVMEEHSTFNPSQFSGKVIAEAKRVVVEQVGAKEVRQDSGDSSFAARFKDSLTATVMKQTTLEWLDRLELKGEAKKKGIESILRQEIHKYDKQSAEGPTQALCAVIALSASIATYGAGSWLSGTMLTATGATGMTAAVVSKMSLALVASLSSQAAVALVCSKGDIGQAAQHLANSKTLKAIALNVAAAGVTAGIANHLGVPLDLDKASLGRDPTFVDHFRKALVTGTVETGFNLATGEGFENALAMLTRATAANSLSGMMANQIGLFYKDQTIDPVTHKLAHAFLGGMSGAILNPDLKQGIIAGAMGAFVAETFADISQPDKPNDKIKALEKERGRRLTKEEHQELYAAELKAYGEKIKDTADWSKIVAATSLLLAQKDIQTGLHTATNALENNFVVFAYFGVMAADLAWAAYAGDAPIDESAYDTDDEADQSTLGKARKVYKDPLNAGAKAIGLDKAAELAGTYAKSFEGGESGYVDAKLAEAERLSGKPLTSAERTMLSEAFTEAYRDESTALHMMEGAGIITQIPGKCVDWFLRYTGLTDKGTARAAGHIVNDAFAATGVGVAGKAAVKNTVRGVSKGLGKGTTKVPHVDYSTPEAPYSLRVDPLTGKGPMHVDSNLFTSADSYTAKGAPRNKDQFWKLWSEKYPETLSKKNINLIKSGKSPFVDQTWIHHFPEHQKYTADKLIHHHIDQGHLTTALPKELHTTAPGRSMFHSNLGGVSKK